MDNAFFNPQLTNLQSQLQQLQSLMGQKQAMAPAPPPRTIDFVDGVTGAQVFLDGMGPNSSAAAFDKNESCFFWLSKDANGTPAPMKKCSFTVEDIPTPGTDTITKQDFDAFEAKIMGMLASMTKREGES